LFGSTVIAKILARWPDLIYLGSFVLFLVAMQMILKEPFIDTYVDPLHNWIEMKLPWLVALILTAKQYYRAKIKKSL
jgi:predicted tellurium resistance membrane protein TerC